MRWRRVILVGFAVLAGLAVLWVGTRVVGNIFADDADPQPVGWSGPIRAPSGGIGSALLPEAAVELSGWTWEEQMADAHPSWADISSVRVTGQRANVVLREMPPAMEGEVLALGVTIDQNGDGVADWVLGIDNRAPVGEHRYWLTDVATGETTLEAGPPYGTPFDSWFPGEQGGDARDGPRGTITLDVLRDVDRDRVLMYAWASLADADGTLIAWDYAPDTAWIRDR